MAEVLNKFGDVAGAGIQNIGAIVRLNDPITEYIKTLLNDADGATARTTLALGATDSPTFAGVAATGRTFQGQPAPAVVDVTATVTVANLQARILTSTSAAAVTATLPTGTLMDGLYSAGVDMSYDWDVINTGPSAVTVAAGVDHTVVGAAGVATLTSANFRSRRTAANVWVTYRL